MEFDSVIARLLALGALVAIPSLVIATTLSPFPVEALLENSDRVARVRVLEARVHSFKTETGDATCGVAYRAEIRESLKGNASIRELSFASSASLAVNEDYLIFFTRSKGSKQGMESGADAKYNAATKAAHDQ